MSCTVTKSSVKGTNLPSSKGCKCSCPFATPYSLLRVKIARILNGYEPGLDRNSEPPKCSTMLFHLGQRSLFLATQRWFDLGNSYWCINLPSCPTLVAPNCIIDLTARSFQNIDNESPADAKKRRSGCWRKNDADAEVIVDACFVFCRLV